MTDRDSVMGCDSVVGRGSVMGCDSVVGRGSVMGRGSGCRMTTDTTSTDAATSSDASYNAGGGKSMPI
jgi:hypothetical protein